MSDEIKPSFVFEFPLRCRAADKSSSSADPPPWREKSCILKSLSIPNLKNKYHYLHLKFWLPKHHNADAGFDADLELFEPWV